MGRHMFSESYDQKLSDFYFSKVNFLKVYFQKFSTEGSKDERWRKKKWYCVKFNYNFYCSLGPSSSTYIQCLPVWTDLFCRFSALYWEQVSAKKLCAFGYSGCGFYNLMVDHEAQLDATVTLHYTRFNQIVVPWRLDLVKCRFVQCGKELVGCWPTGPDSSHSHHPHCTTQILHK